MWSNFFPEEISKIQNLRFTERTKLCHFKSNEQFILLHNIIGCFFVYVDSSNWTKPFLISLFGRTAINVFKRLVWRALGYQGFRTLPTEVNKWSKNEDFWSVIQNDTIGTSYRNNVWFSIDWGIKNVTYLRSRILL